MADAQGTATVLANVSIEAAGLRDTIEGKPDLTAEEVRDSILKTHREVAALSKAIHDLLMTPAQPPPPNPAQQYDMERRDAVNRIWLESHLKGADDRSKLVADIGLNAIRSLFLVNGGAIVALLTFLGTGRGPLGSVMLQVAFRDFVTGLALTLLASGIAWIGQQLFSQSEYDKASAVYLAVINKEPEKPISNHYTGGLILQIITAVLATGGLLFFCLGAFDAMAGLSLKP
jgi:hypothetical protein